MAVSLTTTEVSHTGTASAATAYTIPFGWGSDSELEFTVTDADGAETTPTAVTITAVTEESGTVTFDAAIAATDTITIRRATARTQPASFETAAPLAPATLEAVLDRMVRCLQEIEARAVRVDAAVSALTPTANGVLGFDADGVLTVLTPAEVVAAGS